MDCIQRQSSFGLKSHKSSRKARKEERDLNQRFIFGKFCYFTSEYVPISSCCDLEVDPAG